MRDTKDWWRNAARGPSARARLMAISLAGFLVLGAFASVPLSRAFADTSDSVADLGVVDAEYQQAKRLLEAYRAEQLDVLDENHDAEIAEIDAAEDAALAAIDAQFTADRVALDEAHEARLAEIDADRDTRRAEIEAAYVTQLAEVEAFYTDLIAQLAPEGLSDKELENAFKAAERQVKAARTAELDALEATYETESAAAEEAFEAIESALEDELNDLKNTLRADLDALSDVEEAALDLHDARTEAMLAPHEAEKKYWETEKKAIEKTIDAIYKPEIDRLKEKGKWDKAAELDAERKAERFDQTIVQRAMIDELKGIIDAIKDAQRAIEESIKDDLEQQESDLKAVNAADVADARNRLEDAKDEYEALDDVLSDDFDAASDAVDDAYAAMLSHLKDKYSGFASSLDDEESRLKTTRDDGLKRADATREAARKAENSEYEQAKRMLERNHESDRDAAETAHDRAADDADARFEQATARVLRNHERNMDMLQSEHFILRERVRSFLASDQLVPLGEYFDPQSDPGSLFNVAKRIKSNHDEYTGAGVQIALIDTGIIDVEGLRSSNVTIGPDFSFEDAAESLRARDTNGHGTHLAGIMVASDPAFVTGDTQRRPDRVLGIAPAAQLVSLKVGAADGAVDVTQVIAAIDWVIAANESGDFQIRVINLAFGTDGVQDYQIDPLSFAVERAWHSGIVVVVAAGNDGLDATRLTNPATNPYVIAVGAGQAKSDHDLVLAGFSNGSDGRGVDVVAPGRSIASLRNPGSFADVMVQAELQDAALVRGSGTSQAAAVVSGVIALMLEERPGLTPDQVKWLLMDSAKEARDANAGAGFIDANKAIGQNLPSDPAEYTQTWATSDGSGSMDAARGNVRVMIDGVVLEGEQDIFGNSWTGNSWTGNSWTGNSWTGNSWTGNSWTGNSWTGNSWTGNSWTGNSWTGNSWTGNSWTGNSWTGNSWTGNSWTGNSWTGNSWTSVVWGS